MSDLEYPADLRYTREHEWVKDNGDGSFRVGITSYAQEALGSVVLVTLPEVGAQVSAGEPCGEIDSPKSVSDLYSPLTGEVSAINEALDSAAELVNSDPYGEGWMYDVRPVDAAEAATLMDATAYQAQLD